MTTETEQWIKEFRVANSEDYLNVLMIGHPTMQLLDQLIDLVTSLRNEWPSELAEVVSEDSK